MTIHDFLTERGYKPELGLTSLYKADPYFIRAWYKTYTQGQHERFAIIVEEWNFRGNTNYNVSATFALQFPDDTWIKMQVYSFSAEQLQISLGEAEKIICEVNFQRGRERE